jgi:uncharacterized protein (DUF1330 family)|tara:strand:- start:10 stop:324 length:315 start_codon:yes stop_codon:yes gene_type:complete
MSDTAVYIIANLVTHDKAEYLKYEKGFFPLLKKHGGSFITYDDNIKHMEGTEPRPGRIVMFQFPSESAAETWYNDPDYQALSEHRRAGAELKSLTMVHGLPPRK